MHKPSKKNLPMRDTYTKFWTTCEQTLHKTPTVSDSSLYFLSNWWSLAWSFFDIGWYATFAPKDHWKVLQLAFQKESSHLPRGLEHCANSKKFPKKKIVEAPYFNLVTALSALPFVSSRRRAHVQWFFIEDHHKLLQIPMSCHFMLPLDFLQNLETNFRKFLIFSCEICVLHGWPWTHWEAKSWPTLAYLDCSAILLRHWGLCGRLRWFHRTWSRGKCDFENCVCKLPFLIFVRLHFSQFGSLGTCVNKLCFPFVRFLAKWFWKTFAVISTSVDLGSTKIFSKFL